jgi:DNA (cytosine-5)-methyltransferase 1
MDKGHTVIDLFCGAGGLSEGFRQSGFQVLVGQDWDEAAGLTFLHTHPGAKFIGGSIKNVESNTLLRSAGLKRGELDVLVGGPPCQGFSVNNHKRGADDPRTMLFREYLRIVEGLHPRWLVMENVTGMLSIENGKFIRAITTGMERLGYSVEMKLLKAEEFGVPQERRRLVFIANRTGAKISFPETTHGPSMKPFTTIWDAISDLPKVNNGEASLCLKYLSNPKNDFQSMVRGVSYVPENHSAPKLSALNLERMTHIPPGGSWRDIPLDLLPEGMKKAKRSDHTKRYGRPKKSDLSCTILTKCDIHWGAYIHPTQDRAFTVREAARLQSFPDSFVFHGSRTEQYVQVGNAVPPLLARRIAEHLLELQSNKVTRFVKGVSSEKEINERAA